MLDVANMSRAQLKALIALSGENIKLLEEEKPQPKRGCICLNEGKPDNRPGSSTFGFIVNSPSCPVEGHGLRTRFIPQSRLTQPSARTVGVIHNTRRES